MKKKLIVSAAMVGAASFMMLSGFDSAQTADSILKKSTEASQAAKSVTSAATAKADVSMSAPDAGASFDLTGDGTMDIQVSMDPLAVSVTGSFSGSAMGQSGSMDVSVYMVTEEDGSIKTYTGTGGSWSVETIDADEAQKLQSMITSSYNLDLTSLPITYTLGTEPVEVDGKECYQLTTTLTWDDITKIVDWSYDNLDMNALMGAAEASSEDADESVAEQEEDIKDAKEEITNAMAQIAPYVTGLQINMEMDIDASTYLPLRARLDMNGSDWSNLSMVLGSMMGMTNEDGTAMNVTLDVKDLYLEYTYDYDTPVTVVVPDEVKASAEAAEAQDDGTDMGSELSDLAENLG